MSRAFIPVVRQTDATEEAARVMGICNSCRYCEGFCAVFPAMERRLQFTAESIHFLANLCHNCGACYHACQYAPPHEFAIEVPKAMAAVRKETYANFATPGWFGRLYQQQGVALVAGSVLGFVVIFILAFVLAGKETEKLFLAASSEQLFYDITPHHVLVGLFGPVFLFSIIVMALSGYRYWRMLKGMAKEEADRIAEVRQTLSDIVFLRYLDGGGQGCAQENDQPTQQRRVAHQMVFFGFMLCFASTSLATFYHYGLGVVAPYPVISLPKLLGITGGLLMVIGCLGALVQRRRRHEALIDSTQSVMDVGFVTLLLIVSASGLLSMALRSTAAMPLLHLVHLSAVLTFFLLMPYCKFVHGLYRGLALGWHNREQRNPSRLQLSEG